MKRNTVKILIIATSALCIIFFLLVNLAQTMPQALQVPAKKEISIDIMIEKKKVKIPKPKVKKIAKPKPIKAIKAKIKKRKAPASSTSLKEEVLNGALPPISANYREHLGFARYARAMHARGARFYILGSSKKQIYKINLSVKSLSKVSSNDIINKNFSPRTRVIEDEPALQFFINKAKSEFNITNPRVILLVPQRMEQQIASQLVKNGINLNKFQAFRGTYLRSSGDFTLKIYEGLTNNGSQNLNIAITL